VQTNLRSGVLVGGHELEHVRVFPFHEVLHDLHRAALDDRVRHSRKVCEIREKGEEGRGQREERRERMQEGRGKREEGRGEELFTFDA
jgi:hypothetical protein